MEVKTYDGIISEIHIFDPRVESIVARALVIYFTRFNFVARPKFVRRYITEDEQTKIESMEPTAIDYDSQPELIPAAGAWR